MLSLARRLEVLSTQRFHWLDLKDHFCFFSSVIFWIRIVLQIPSFLVQSFDCLLFGNSGSHFCLIVWYSILNVRNHLSMISAAWQLFVSLSRGDLNRIAQVIFECKLFYPQLFNNFFNNFRGMFVRFSSCTFLPQQAVRISRLYCLICLLACFMQYWFSRHTVCSAC